MTFNPRSTRVELSSTVPDHFRPRRYLIWYVLPLTRAVVQV